MQEVNLYLPEFFPTSDWLSAKNLVSVVLALIAVLSISAWHQNENIEQYQLELAALEAQQKLLSKSVEALKSAPRIDEDARLQLQIVRLEYDIQSLKMVQSSMLAQSPGNDVGFSPILHTLAEQSLASLALQRIRISHNGKRLDLQGVTRQAGDVPLYLSALQAEVSMSSVEFGLLSMNLQKAFAGRYQFALGFESLYQKPDLRVVSQGGAQ
ncbi:MAG: hypothetical protein COA42_09610 [Alteromonadaceae bacterium]|nr:MAG: hypothetical protein COA42_09610 [Alteromonadaceae bacterium]